MGPFPSSYGYKLILLAVDYMSKWVEAIPTITSDARVVLCFIRSNIFSRFGTLRAVISDEGSHLCNKMFALLLAKYGVKHQVTLAYHPKAMGKLRYQIGWYASVTRCFTPYLARSDANSLLQKWEQVISYHQFCSPNLPLSH